MLLLNLPSLTIFTITALPARPLLFPTSVPINPPPPTVQANLVPVTPFQLILLKLARQHVATVLGGERPTGDRDALEELPHLGLAIALSESDQRSTDACT